VATIVVRLADGSEKSANSRWIDPPPQPQCDHVPDAFVEVFALAMELHDRVEQA
jgi:hypothetical protein